MCTVLLYFDKISAHDRLHQLYYHMIFLIFHNTWVEKKLLKFSVRTFAYTNLNSFFLISKTWPDSRAVKVMSLQISLYELILREQILKWAERFFPANLPQPATAGLRSKEFRYLTSDLWEKCVFWLQKMKNLREGLRFSQKIFRAREYNIWKSRSFEI